MLFWKIYPLIAVSLFNALCFGEEYSFPIEKQRPPECKPLHWLHYATNTAVEINGIEIDILMFAEKSKDFYP